MVWRFEVAINCHRSVRHLPAKAAAAGGILGPMQVFDLAAERNRLALEPDCAKCFGLCCVANSLKASATFAIDKLPGKPCPHLQNEFGCGIHDALRQQGFSGCTAYTCYGAGQKVAQQLFAGADWRRAPQTAELMFQTLPVVRQLHHLLWFITEALDRYPSGPDHTELLGLLAETERLTTSPPDEMSWGAIDDHCLTGEDLLGRVSAAIRAGHETARPGLRSAPTDVSEVPRVPFDPEGDQRRDTDWRGADLRSADLRGIDLRGCDLKGANLADADLSGADLRWVDLMGTDLGRTNLAAADLSAVLFLTQSQLELARGDVRTTLSDPLRTPTHWSGPDGEAGRPWRSPVFLQVSPAARKFR